MLGCHLTAHPNCQASAWRPRYAYELMRVNGSHRSDLPPVAELATEYGVARSTVVAALRRIAADGLVVIVSNWGTFRT
jgi:DNA-binding MarR family transcriptional regulator